jgi:hypothetical protein
MLLLSNRKVSIITVVIIVSPLSSVPQPRRAMIWLRIHTTFYAANTKYKGVKGRERNSQARKTYEYVKKISFELKNKKRRGGSRRKENSYEKQEMSKRWKQKRRVTQREQRKTLFFGCCSSC